MEFSDLKQVVCNLIWLRYDVCHIHNQRKMCFSIEQFDSQDY